MLRDSSPGTMQQDPHPLAIIPVQRDLLLSDTSSTSSSGSSPSDAPSVNIRSLVPRSGVAPAAASDSAFMRSLISVLPNEEADSQFSVASLARRSNSREGMGRDPWIASHPATAFGDEDDGSSSNRGHSGKGGQSTPVATTDGLPDSGLDFLGTTESVRDLLHLPYTSDAITVGLHRVGKTLVLDGNLGEVLGTAAAASKATGSAPPPTSRGARSSSNEGDGAKTGAQGSATSARHSGTDGITIGGGDEEGRWVMVGRRGKPRREEDNDAAAPPPSATAATVVTAESETGGEGWSVHQSTWPALGAAVEASETDDTDTSGNGILSIVPSRPRGNYFGSRPPEPAGFWRSFQWELSGMRLMLGSSLQVCSTSEHPQVSVRLHESDENLSLCTCLDYYLDNVMENVPELALCMREKGYIQGCRLVNTEDIPYLGSLSRKSHESSAPGSKATGGVGGPVPLFDPVVVELNATILLRFLQENCSREGGTYLLHRSEGAAHVQLYDVSALSRQRNRRWKWLLAMLCYRFALRISHHIRQPWCGVGGPETGIWGRRSSSDAARVDAGSSLPGPEVVRQWQRRQRQLLENSLELLEELAQLGGGGHETICASVQEHIADTYLIYGGMQSVLSEADKGADSASDINHGGGHRRASKGSRSNAASVAASAVVDPESAAKRPHSRTSWTADDNGKVWNTSADIAQKGRRRSGVKTERRESANGVEGFQPGVEGQSFPGSSRLSQSDGGGTLTGAGDGKADRYAENLDKAQGHLTSGIAILRDVMARQEAAAAGRYDLAADVVIVGEKGVPVGVMRQQRSPWLAVDDEGDEIDCVAQEHRDGAGFPDKDRTTQRRSRRGSRDESEDPTTAMSVVSEQLFRLQQKLVGTYVVAARARLSKGFPNPSLAASSAPSSQKKSVTRRDVAISGREYLEDTLDDEARAELVAGSIDSLCAAWDHVLEAMVTLDRRAAAMLMKGERGSPTLGVRDPLDDNDILGEPKDSSDSDLRRDALNHQADRASDLGPLWKGSLSEALARSGSGDGVNGVAHSYRTFTGLATVDRARPYNASFDLGLSKLPGKEGAIRSFLTWDHAARRQLETRQAELHELCGDVAHVCVPLQAALGQSVSPAVKGLIKRLEELLSRACPPLELGDLDVCHDLHGRVWESLNNSSTASTAPKAGRKGVRLQSHHRSCASSADPRPLAETCVHRLAKAGHVPADARIWSLHLAVEACYGRALEALDMDSASHSPHVPSLSADRRGRDGYQWDAAFASGSVVEACARLKKKRGDASNELGKLMAKCASSLAQTPPQSTTAGLTRPTSSHLQATMSQPPHPGLSFAVCVACAQSCFQRSLAEFQAIDNSSNTALVLCNLASMARMKSRAFARLKEACSEAGSDAVVATQVGVSVNAENRRGDSASEKGGAEAVKLCGDAHAALGSRDTDARTWDHVSSELAMAYLCLGVERRQELLTALLRPDTADIRTPEPAGSSSSPVRASEASAFLSHPSMAQVRSVVEPLERALQIYTDMNNASQAAACHYQIGLYHAKVLPAYLGSSITSVKPAARGSNSGKNGSSKAWMGGTKNAAAPKLQHAKAWEEGQRAARHLLAARAYFAIFEQGPTSVVLALDLCDLYLSLANMISSSVLASTLTNELVSGTSDLSGEESHAVANATSVVVPSATGVRPPPAVPVRYECLEGALRSLLDTRAVFAAVRHRAGTRMVQTAGGDNTAPAATEVAGSASAAGQRLLCLLETVTGRLPRVLQAMVRASVEMKMQATSASILKSMYKRSMLGMRSGGEGAHAMLDGLAAQYDALNDIRKGG